MIKTLLLPEIHCPNAAQGALAKELLDEWPSYLAYAVPSFSFGSIITAFKIVLRKLISA
jgi:hypothetical protein